jgi:hypothetical protein
MTMFAVVQSPTEHFLIAPLPPSFFETPPPFGGGAMLILNKFDNNSASLRAEHVQGILIAAAQASGNVSACEAYGITDRTGSESFNLALSTRRANTALAALNTALSLGSSRLTFANGLGERFADEYFQLADGTESGKKKGTTGRNEDFRGVVCYLWESFATATDPFLQVSIAFAAPPTGGGGLSRTFLPALHMGRLRAQPRSPFA